ncbi:hypothetical protein LINPERHAP1_LOCUS7024 [Linum perenne]
MVTTCLSLTLVLLHCVIFACQVCLLFPPLIMDVIPLNGSPLFNLVHHQSFNHS